MGITGRRGARYFRDRLVSEDDIGGVSLASHALCRRGLVHGVVWPALACLFVASTDAARADDEIQVYTGEIVEVGKWTAQYHFNYAIKGRKEPEFPGGLIPNRTLNATGEFAYGVTPWFEAGFYVPWAIDKDGYHSNAMKLRTLFVTPDAAKREFFYGLNIEYQYLMPKFSNTRWGMELRPIIGWRKGDYEFIMNPIVDLSFGRNGEVVFAPNARLARNFGEDLAFAIEYYTDLGPIGRFLPFQEQGHNIFGVVDFKVGRFDIEFGVGYGLTQGSDRWMTKLMVTTNLFDSPEDEKSEPQGTVKKLQTAKAPIKKAPEKKAASEPAYNYSGCYVGGYFGGPSIAHLETNDPVTSGGVFYSAAANAANGGAYRIEFKQSPIAGGTLGCNWQARGSHFVYGAEGETGYMRLRANAVDPYSNNTVFDSTVIGNWYGALAGRAGWATDRAWFYGKAGVGFTDIKSSVVGGPGLLTASNSNSSAFWVAGGGIDWAWTGNWTLKMEYLFLGLDQTQSVCGPSGGLTYCASHSVGGVHTTKLGLNYKFY